MEKEYILRQLRESGEVKQKIAVECTPSILSAFTALSRSLEAGGKVLLCGNGGSAADSQHIAAELIIKMNKSGRRALPALALTTDSSILTAGGNDIGFENIFSRQIEALGNASDILIAISTSGESENVVRAVQEAKKKGMTVIGFLGKGGGKLKGIVDVPIVIPSADTQRIQEGHITVAHILCGLIEEKMA